MCVTVLILLAVLAIALLYHGKALLSWVVPGTLFFTWWGSQGESLSVMWWLLVLPFGAIVAVFGLPPLRRKLVTGRVLSIMAPIFPAMSETERVALEAGTVWWDADLFSGKPYWKKLLDFKGPGLTQRERNFIENEVAEACRLVDSDEVDSKGDISEEAWQFIKDKGFMGIIVPTQYGGLGFSAEANSAIVTKVSSHNITLGVTVMVPNSLGPAELLLHYGTEDQKNHYLPRLASGTEVPAFALTEPVAGSDASSMTSSGVVCKGQWEGAEVVGIRLNWNKRYITLAPICTLLGLAFKLFDPEGLIGAQKDLGITCALIPADMPGVETGRRHDPLGIKFLNGPTTGTDIFIPLDYIIGGAPMAGQGWRMLMDCLSAGRSISLPGLACGAAELTTRLITSYSIVREQFGLPLARFEGVVDKLANIGGGAWWMNATRSVTAAAVASGQKPSVLSAIVKAYLTEAMRDIVNDGMDIQGGAAISRGPRNKLARMYQAIPIGITVEGANILTRTLIIYGQGALRCHPFAFNEMEAARSKDLIGFDKAFFGHVGFIVSNLTRAKFLGFTGARFAHAPLPGPTQYYFRQLTRCSADFAVVSDAAMGIFGGGLKRKERITGRLSDALAWMYIGSCSLKHYVDQGQKSADEPFMRWACEHALNNIQEALAETLANFPNRWIGRLLHLAIFPLGRPYSPPSDRLSSKIVRSMSEDDQVRDELTKHMHYPHDEGDTLRRLDLGRKLLLEAAPLRKKLKDAMRAGTLPRKRELLALDEAREKKLLTEEQCKLLRDALELQDDLIQVDAFSADEYLARCGS
ncbi:MAG: acyl-CoA dehydrogenase [Chlamydiales bacterium]|jgi:acyl-CoA dehydrogenase